jgi:hypothetical protein
MFNLTASMAILMIVVFYYSYFRHWRQMVTNHDRYFKNRMNPAAFTLKSKISAEMWQISNDEYESNGILQNAGISKVNFMMN